MAKFLNLNAHLYFEAVARRGTVTRAAEELSVSPSAVSQQIRQLEQQLGIKLFRREGRLLSLTLEGEQLYQSCSTALRMLHDARQNLGRTKANRRLNLRVTPSFGVRWLGPRMSDFVAHHPDLDLSVDAAPDPTDFDREVMDLDIRYGIGGWEGLHTQSVMRDQVLPLCSPAYLEGLPKSGDPAEVLDKARLIDSARALCQWDSWLLRNRLATSANRKTILMDRSTMALQLALDGAGVVLESLALAADEVAAGRLVPVTPSVPVISFPAYWVICPGRNLNRRAVRLFLDWLDVQRAEHDAATARIVARHGLVLDEIGGATELTVGPEVSG